MRCMMRIRLQIIMNYCPVIMLDYCSMSCMTPESDRGAARVANHGVNRLGCRLISPGWIIAVEIHGLVHRRTGLTLKMISTRSYVPVPCNTPPGHQLLIRCGRIGSLELCCIHHVEVVLSTTNKTTKDDLTVLRTRVSSWFHHFHQVS
jgi:hypothetical protein